MTLPHGVKSFLPQDYQYLVDTVHMDNDEGILYKVLKVYRKRDAFVVDRVIFETDKPNNPGGITDCVYLSDILQYPIILGKSNPRHSGNTTSSIATARQDIMSTS
jgi:hypothetical protein